MDSVFHLNGILPAISSSTKSMDIEELTGDDVLPSLISESITLDTLSTRSSDIPPKLLSKPPIFSMIGLGDHLRLFSACSSQSEVASEFRDPAMISTPTWPRLNRLLKECLDIRKWVETSSSWRPPGHVPWGPVVHESPFKSWLPEGSCFSKESFSLALSKTRPSLGDCAVASCQSTLHPALASAQGSSVMGQNSCGNQFEELPPPSLVISNSHFTFPIPLDGLSNNTLASRRGKQPPPSLLVQKEDFPYPDISTIFPGSPTETYTFMHYSDKSAEPSLRFEEMIHKLRLQCSTMALRTPPMDSSWNSRAAVESVVSYHPTADEESPSIDLNSSQLRGHDEFLSLCSNSDESWVSKVIKNKKDSIDLQIHDSDNPAIFTVTGTLNSDFRHELHYSSVRLPPSAMKKGSTCSSSKHPKTVRFAMLRDSDVKSAIPIANGGTPNQPKLRNLFSSIPHSTTNKARRFINPTVRDLLVSGSSRNLSKGGPLRVKVTKGPAHATCGPFPTRSLERRSLTRLIQRPSEVSMYEKKKPSEAKKSRMQVPLIKNIFNRLSK